MPANANVNSQSSESGAAYRLDSAYENDAKNWTKVPGKEGFPEYSVYLAPIQKSASDDRSYRIVKLSNGLEAVLVQDAATDKAAASLDVAVGHLSDPDDIPGLAHFCEHLLFMGTEQFPKENEYSEYLAKHGGSSNAYTAADTTNYYFNINSNAFSGALERFSGFFHSPLFSPSCTLRELNAVDSENKKNLQSDMWRIFQLNKHLTRPGHPWNKFGTGNKQTLTEAARKLKATKSSGGHEKPSLSEYISGNSSAVPSPIPSRMASPAPSVSSTSSESDADGGMVGRETRRRLIEWWSKEYCASRMSLTMIGRESLDELTELAVKFFSPIEDRGQESAPIIPEHPFGENEQGTIVHVKTIMDFYAIELSFPLPYQAPYWRVKPGSFISHYTGHEGPGSLHAYLKNKGWITSLSSGEQALARGFAMFKLTVHLTKSGFEHYREAMLACYKYINLLQSSVLQDWAQDEMKALADLRFRFAEKRRPDNYAVWISEAMKNPVPRSLVLSGPKLLWSWDEQLVRDNLNSLTVEKSRAVVMAKDHSVIGKTGPWSNEPWYKTEYSVDKLDGDFYTSARAPNDIFELALPEPNEFIPSNVDVDKKLVSEPAKRPSLVRSSALSEVWHKKDDQFWLPRAQVTIEARTPGASTSPRASVMTRLFVDLVRDSLTEDVYNADLAGLSYEIGSTMLGFYVSISGYNDKQHVLLQHILRKVKSLEIKETRLAVMKEQVKRQWENFFLGQSYHLSDYYGKYLLAGHQFTLKEKLAEIDGIDVGQLQEFVKVLTSRFKYITLVNGNLRKEDADKIAVLTEGILGSQPIPGKELPREYSRLLPEACNYVVELPIPNPNQVNAAISYYCHIGNISDARVRTTLRLLADLMHEPCFNMLRTKEQLGYIVFCSPWQSTESIGLRVLVQSEKDPKYLETRINGFLVHMRETLELMPETEFEEHKRGLAHKWTEKLKNLNEESSRFWNQIESGYLDFTRREDDAARLANVTKNEVLDLFTRYIDPTSDARSKLSIHMRPQTKPAKKLSLPAAQAFIVSLRAAGATVDEEAFIAQCSDEPLVSAIREHWEQVLNEQNLPTEALLAELDHVAESYPALGQGPAELDAKAVFVTDVAAFRASLKPSEFAKPVDAPSDMAFSKY